MNVDTLSLAAKYVERMQERRTSLASFCAQILADSVPFVWEVGCGHGHFLTAYAAAFPRQLCLGIDTVAKRIARAQRKKDRFGLSHLHFVRADAQDFLNALPMGARFSDVYILFPDPWPKRRHRKNRLLQPAFLKQIAGRAGRGAALRIRTDHKGYFEEIAAMIGADPAWRISDKNEWPLEIPTVFQQKSTHYFSITALRT